MTGIASSRSFTTVGLLLLAACAASEDRGADPKATSGTGDAGGGGATTSGPDGGMGGALGLGGLASGGTSSTGSGVPYGDPTICDDGIALTDADPLSAARAIELCQPSQDSPGLIEAKYVRADGSPAPPTSALQFGIMDNFGANVLPRAGNRMLVLSTGYARIPGQPDICGSIMCSAGGQGVAPPGFPDNPPECTWSGSPPEYLTSIYDDIGLEVRLKAPDDATGYQFAFKLYSFEYPEFVCSPYNDQFVALVDPPPMGAVKGNICFDGKKHPASVNLAFFDACDPAGIDRFAMSCVNAGGDCPPTPNPYCPKGMGELIGTGFESIWLASPWIGNEDGGATAWLQTSAPVGGGEEVSIRFAIWDKADAIYDATALIDRFEWLTGGGVEVDTDVPK